MYVDRVICRVALRAPLIFDVAIRLQSIEPIDDRCLTAQGSLAHQTKDARVRTLALIACVISESQQNKLCRRRFDRLILAALLNRQVLHVVSKDERHQSTAHRSASRSPSKISSRGFPIALSLAGIGKFL